MPSAALIRKASATRRSRTRGANGIAARREESDEARRHSEIIGVTFLEAERTWRVTANALEGMRDQNRRCRDGKHAGADQHKPRGQVLGYPHPRRHIWRSGSRPPRRQESRW